MSGTASVGKDVGGVVANVVGRAVGVIVDGNIVVGDGEGCGSTGDSDGAIVAIISSARLTTCAESIDGIVRSNASVTVVGVNASFMIPSNNCGSVGICPVDDSTST